MFFLTNKLLLESFRIRPEEALQWLRGGAVCTKMIRQTSFEGAVWYYLTPDQQAGQEQEILSYMAHNVYMMLWKAKYEHEVRSSESNQHPVLCSKVLDTPGQV